MNSGSARSGDRLDLCFIGCGRATRMHSRTLAGFRDQVRLHYASRDAAKAAEYARRHRGGHHFGSYDEALTSSGIDVVFIATPPAAHLELALAALAAGKHAIVEKPAFLHSGDVASVREAARRAGRQALVAENYCYKPLTTRLRELIERRVVGDVLFVAVNALKRQATGGDWRDDPTASGGGALFEGGIHWINLLANIGLTVESARGHRPGGAGELERSALVTLEYAEGPVGTLHYSWETPSLFRGLRLSRIYGREGSITFESNGLIVVVGGRRKSVVFPGLRDIAGYRGMFEDFLGALRLGRRPRMDLDQAERDLRLVESAYRSMHSHPAWSDTG